MEMKTALLLLAVTSLLGQVISRGAYRKKIPRPKGTKIPWDSVSPRSFLITWDAMNVDFYYVEVLRGYTVYTVKVFRKVTDNSLQLTGLRPSTIYGVQVSAVVDGIRGKPGKPARTRTLWAATVAPTTKPKPTLTPKPGKCGRGYFTCASDGTCIENRLWCDRAMDCEDGTDERGCHDSCKEINPDFRNGNYSCSRFGSPGSVCVFDCKAPHVKDGSWYTVCQKNRRKWSNPPPICRLPASNSFRIIEKKSSQNTLTVEWEPVQSAARYKVYIIEQLSARLGKKRYKKNIYVDSAKCCQTVITGLKPDTEYKMTVTAIDKDDLEAIASPAVYGTTTSSLQKSGEGEVKFAHKRESVKATKGNKERKAQALEKEEKNTSGEKE